MPKLVFEVDSRIVAIYTRKNLPKKLREILEATIISFTEKEPLAKFFPRLTFSVESDSRTYKSALHNQTLAFVKRPESRNCIIHINAYSLINSVGADLDTFQTKSEDIREVLEGSCKHELSHLHHYTVNKDLKVREKTLKKLNNTTRDPKNILNFKKDFTIKDAFILLRALLGELLEVVHLEGIAKFAQWEDRLIFTADAYSALESEAKEKIKQLKSVVEEPGYIKEIGLEDWKWRVMRTYYNIYNYFTSSGACYTLGLHVVYTIKYANPEISLEELFKLPLFKFFKTYEKSCEKLGHQPLITINSGKGLFDYDRAVKELQQKFEEVSSPQEENLKQRVGKFWKKTFRKKE